MVKSRLAKTLEPCCSYEMVVIYLVFFLYKVGESMLDATTRPYIVRSVCRDVFNDNATLCNELQYLPHEEDYVQSIAANYLLYHRLLMNLPAVLLGLMCGAYSDKYGRKIPMMLPSLGSVLGVLVYMASVVSDEARLPLILVGAALQGIMGKSSVITMAVNSYVTDKSDVEERTKYLGKLLAMSFFGLFVGSLFSGVLQDTTDMLTTFCVVVILHAAVVLITIAIVKDSVEYSDQKESEKISFGKECCAIFRVQNIKESVMVLIKPRKGNLRNLILIMFFATILNQTCKTGEMDVTVLFVSRTPLNWPKSWYGYLLSVDYAVMGTCLFLVLPMMTNILKLSDCGILLVGIACKVVRLIWAAFCAETWMVFLSVIIGAFAGMITIALRSLLSKSVAEDESGKIFSLLACGETASKLLGVVIFINLYSATAAMFRGFAFLIEACIYIMMFLLTVATYRELKEIGSFDIMQALSGTKWNESVQNYKTYKGKLPALDEMDENTSVPGPIPATTP